MPNLPPKTHINQRELHSCHEIAFKTRTDSQFLQLMRLCIDFDFAVLKLQAKAYSHLTRKFVPLAPEYLLATRMPSAHPWGDAEWYAVTPGHHSLKELDDYAANHQIDILHDHLFGAEDTTQNYFLMEGT